MAKAAPVAITPDMPFAEAAALTVAVRARELWEHSAGVLDTSDIERVHDMRVATRRLRAVLEIFAACFPRKRHRAVLRDVKALADALGERRDPDVQIELLTGLGFGEDPFVATLRARQAEGNEVLVAALRRAEERDLRGRLERLVEKAR
ncbi:MAG TPA: CHAD domain-containing protein [Solirubrobacteraceae bacterium]